MKSLRFCALLIGAVVACHRGPPPPTVLERLANAPGVTLPEVSGDRLATATPRVRVVVGPDGISVDMDSLWASWPAEARDSFQAAQDAARRADLPLVRRQVVKLAGFAPDHAPESRTAPFPALAEAVSEALEVERRFRAHAKLPEARPSLALVADAHAPYALLVRVIGSAAQSEGIEMAFVARRAVPGADPAFVPLHLPTPEDGTPHLAQMLDRKRDRDLASELADVLADRKKPEPPPPPPAPKPAATTSLWPATPKPAMPKHDHASDDEGTEPLLALNLDAKGCTLQMYADTHPVPGCEAAPLRAVFATLKPVLDRKPPRGADGTCAAPPETGCRSGILIIAGTDTLQLQALVKGMELALEDPTLFTRVMLALMM